MKTFEEAMKLRMASNREQVRAGLEKLERYVSIISEIGQSDTTRSFIMAMVEMSESYPEEMSEDDVYSSVIMSAFVNGVIIGIEMEKSE